MSKITGSLDALKAKQSSLTSKRDKAKTSLEQAKSALQQFLLEGDDSDAKAVVALQAKVDSAASLLTSLDDALIEQARRVAEAEQALNAEQQAAARKAASEAIDADVAAIEQQLAPWLASTRALANALAKYETFRFESGSIAKYLTNASREIEVALSVTIPDLKGGVVAVLEGREEAPRPPAPVVKLVQSAPTIMTVLAMTHGKFLDRDGNIRRIHRHTQVDLPIEMAQRLLKSGDVILPSDPRWRDLVRNAVGQHPPLHLCKDWDDPDAGQSNAAPVYHSAFTPVDRGPAYNIAAPVQRAPIAAACNMPTDTTKTKK